MNSVQRRIAYRTGKLRQSAYGVIGFLAITALALLEILVRRNETAYLLVRVF